MTELYAEAERGRLRAKLRRVEETLDVAYGVRVWSAGHYTDDLVGALVATVLSQSTSDLNSGRAFASLKRAFPSGWDAVRMASVTDVADAIRSGGMANMKAPRIQAILQDIYDGGGQTDLSHLRDWDDAKINAYLKSFHGVGAKTAACLLMFNLGRPVLAVDTHVHRVSRRLGLIGAKATADQAHDLLPELLGGNEAYSLHVHFIEHGRRVCHSQKPACSICPLQSDCDYFQSQAFAEAGA